MADVLLQNIFKVFQGMDKAAVSNVEARIDHGEFIVLVGPSGCGKSTLLRMIAGLETVSRGEISIDGTVVNDMSPRERDIAMVFQNYALYPHMTVFDNMAFGLKMRKFCKEVIRTRVREAAAMLGLEELLHRRPKALSGGQMQRVALGRAIVRRPKLFLFDEPLSNLDAKLRGSMRSEIIKLHKRLGVTMIYVTHDQLEAMTMADRLLVMRDGKVEQEGRPLDVYNEPLNQFVAGFLGNPPMNFISCSISHENNDLLLSNESFRLVATAEMAEVLAPYAHQGSRTVLGVRPEDISEVSPGALTDTKQSVAARIDFLEPMGNEVLATCRFGSAEGVVRLSAQTKVRADGTARFNIDVTRAKLFDPQNGERFF
ncbi:MAG: sn-glycerol-3-phosphate ABC transporter ATP-binding protein UgpC [Desulfobulbaceae bacterium]|nr:sn-glycerol-3-phosphate ABC transporter ATP-binding protein UgpC [Desulfobulbaceae bacterium]